MGKLLLDSLEIRNFRGFRHLQIPHLGRVNLLVGQNNVGKTSLLEALQLYAGRGNPTVIWEILRIREPQKYTFIAPSDSVVDIEDLFVSLNHLFYGHKDIRDEPVAIQIGPASSEDDTLSVSVDWYTVRDDANGRSEVILLQPEGYKNVDTLQLRFTLQFGSELKSNYPITVLSFYDSSIARLIKKDLQEIPCIMRGANELSHRQLEKFWDHIALTNLEKDVLDALRIIAPGTEGLNIVNNAAFNGGERFPIIKLTDMDKPLPLYSLGDGMQRMLGIALALVNAKDGFLLIDEIENGLHYAVLPDMWQLIFEVAQRLNIQVFATAHSWDCIEAFQQAAQEDKQEEGMLIRLEAKKDEIKATLFDERELEIATRSRIEVR